MRGYWIVPRKKYGQRTDTALGSFVAGYPERVYRGSREDVALEVLERLGIDIEVCCLDAEAWERCGDCRGEIDGDAADREADMRRGK